MRGMSSDIIIEVAGYLTPEDGLRLASACRTWHGEVMRSEVLWKRWCQQVWGLEPSQDARQTFFDMLREYKPYRHCYLAVANVWKRLKDWMRRNSPAMLLTLKPPATETSIDEVEKTIGVRFPLSMRCFYRFHDGQNFPNDVGSPPTLNGEQVGEWMANNQQAYHPAALGMLGGWSAYDIHDSLFFIPLNDSLYIHSKIATDGKWHSWANYKLFPVAYSSGRMGQMMISLDQVPEYFGGQRTIPPGTMLYSGAKHTCVFVAGDSFMGYMKEYARRLEEGIYEARLGEPQLFPSGNKLGASDVTTGNMRIQASPVLLPFHSDSSPTGVLRYAYRIRISMVRSSVMPPSRRCQLTRRRWVMEVPGKMDSVTHGEKVIGFDPEFSLPREGEPEKVWEYASLTQVDPEDAAFAQMHGSLYFMPGSISHPEGEEIEATVGHMTLTYDIRSIRAATKWDWDDPVVPL